MNQGKLPSLLITYLAVAEILAAPGAAQVTPIKWKESLKQPAAWYATAEAIRVADNLLLFQRDTGGWPKNIDMAALLTDAEKAALNRQKADDDSTIDNDATYTQLAFLARVYASRSLDRHRDAFLKGLDYLLRAQYANGGWPQYYPRLTGYYRHITYNDDAMIGVMRLLREVAGKIAPYGFVDEARRMRSQTAVEKGTDCILKTQVIVRGKRTVWCAQHDEVTLAPAAARTYEMVSLSGYESVGIVRFLMGVEHPKAQVIDAVESAIAWFQKTKIAGIRWVQRPDPAGAGGFERFAVRDPGAGPLWARFYEIGTDRPIFSGRDSVIKYDVSEIEAERRNGYRWYVDTPAELLLKDYPAWRQRLNR